MECYRFTIDLEIGTLLGAKRNLNEMILELEKLVCEVARCSKIRIPEY